MVSSVSAGPEAQLVAVSNYTPQAGSTRVRLYDWFRHLGLTPQQQCYAGLPNSAPASLIRNLPAVLRAERTLRTLDVAGRRVVMSRSASPLSRGGVETRLLREATHSVYDFDDAVYLQTSWRTRVSAAPSKFASCVRAATVVVAGSEHLAEAAAAHRPDVFVIPSCIEPADYRPKTDWEIRESPRIVWIGSAATEDYLLPLLPALDRLHRSASIEMTVISTGRPNPRFGDRSWIRTVPWRLETAAAELARADVAIAPLTDTPYARGKCAYKLLQYAATGLPMVGSPVGANRLALERLGGSAVDDDWFEPLLTVLQASADERQRLGAKALAGVRRWYSFDAWAPTWLDAVGLGKAQGTPEV